MATVVNLNGVIGPPESATVSVFDHGFLYGDSVYETLKAIGTRCLHLERHLARLKRSADLIGLQLPGTARELEQAVVLTLASVTNAISAVRLMVTRGEGPIGLDPRLCERPNLIIVARPYAALPDEAYIRGVKLMVARTFRNSPRALDPEIKSGNFLNNIMAQREAIAEGALEALLLNQEGLLTEATQSNVFLVSGGVLRTPHPRAGLLRGVTRGLVVELAGAREDDVFVSELYEAEEMFLTSTLKGVVPVTGIGNRPVGDGKPGPVTERVRALVAAEAERYLAAPG